MEPVASGYYSGEQRTRNAIKLTIHSLSRRWWHPDHFTLQNKKNQRLSTFISD